MTDETKTTETPAATETLSPAARRTFQWHHDACTFWLEQQARGIPVERVETQSGLSITFGRPPMQQPKGGGK